MMWQTIQTDEDVAELMWAASHFHDWAVSGFRYSQLPVPGDADEAGRSPMETNSLILTMRYDTQDEDGNWPEVELEFTEVGGLRFRPMEINYVQDCSLQRARHGWVFAVEDRLSEEELADPWTCRAASFIHANKVRWRIQLATSG